MSNSWNARILRAVRAHLARKFISESWQAGCLRPACRMQALQSLTLTCHFELPLPERPILKSVIVHSSEFAQDFA
jgi:hypothetical protein